MGRDIPPSEPLSNVSITRFLTIGNIRVFVSDGWPWSSERVPPECMNIFNLFAPIAGNAGFGKEGITSAERLHAWLAYG